MAGFKDYVFSAGVGPSTVQNESELRTRNGSPVLKFIPNVPSNLIISFETKYLDLAYSFTSSEASDPKRERSKYRDLRANAILGSIDLRFNYQFYQGAPVKESGRTEFYKDYEVRSTNGEKLVSAPLS